MGSAKFRNMIFPYVLLLFLSWPYAEGTENKDLKDAKETKSVETPEILIDQIAIASENVVRKTEEKEEEERIADEAKKQTTYYENSNGFVPMTSFSASETINNNRQAHFYEKPNDDKLDGLFEDRSKLEDDPAFSTEARIMLNLPQSGTNRRSFDLSENQNDFELLKVKNDTPAIANYHDFYDNVESTVENMKAQRTLSSQKSRDRGKRIESYVTNYGAENDHDNDDRDSSHSYYSYSTEKERKKSAHEPEKVQSNYHQQDSMNYNGHGSNAAITRNAPATSSPRTNPQDNELGENKHADHDYDGVVSTSVASKSRHRFLRPVVVAEPSDYKVEMKFNEQPSESKLSSTSFKTSSKSDSSFAASDNYNVYVKDAARSFDHSDTSDYSVEYSDYTERPRRLHKSRRRPHYSEASRKLPKEHRGSFEDSMDVEERRRPSHSRSKSHRHRTKGHSWIEDDREEESFEERPHDTRGAHSVRTESKNTKNQQGSKPRTSSSWSQITPNIEISHSSGIEIEQPDKPKLLVPVKVNLMPVGNFDHDTALGNSQGFDVSNAVLHNFVTAAPTNTVSTVAPVLTTTQTTIGKTSKNIVNMAAFPQVQNGGVSTPVPDIIVGHNTFHNPLQSIIVPQANAPRNNSRPQYIPGTVASIFAVTPTGNPVLQSFSIQNVPTTARPTSIYTAIPNVTPALLMNQVQATTPHLIFSQPTFEPLANMVHTPVPTSQTNIQVNPHGLQGQNAISNANMQAQHLQIVPAITSTTQSPTVTRLNIISGGFQNKKNTFSDGNGNYLASASLAVSQAVQKPNNGNNYYVQNQNNQQMYKPEMQENRQYIQATPIIPTVLNAGTNLHNFNVNSQQLVQNQQNNPTGNFLQQMQMQLQRNQLLNVNALPSFTYQAIDNTGSNSNNNVNTLNGRNSIGVKNVEIVNPNIKPSPVDTTNINSNGGVSQYPAAVFTTSMPIFATTNAFVTARPQPSTISPDIVSVQNYLDSLTEIGSKGSQSNVVNLKPPPHNQERPVFDPINFVPNLDVVKNQAILNNKQNTNTQTQQQALNLVPLVPGGNFFKPSLTAQKDLLTKPKLTSDLEKYAEEMFKESLRTIYNSHKWNNDHKIRGNIFNSSDIDLSQLKSELQKLKSAMPNLKTPKEILEAHQSEHNIRASELTKPSNFGNDQKKDPLLSTLEQLLKAHPTEPIQVYSSSSSNKHAHSPIRPSVPDPGPTYQTDIRNHKHPHHFLIPPKHNHHSPKNHYHDKPSHRPVPHRHRHNDKPHFHGPRRHPKPRQGGPEASASNVNGVHVHGPKFDHFHGRPSYSRENSGDSDFGAHRHRSNYQQSASSYDTYPTFTTSSPEKDYLNKFSNEWKASRNNDYLDLNHPRIHNLLGLLMKNKQLPAGETQNVFRDKDELKKFFEDEKRRLQQQFYDDALKDPLFRKRADSINRSNPMSTSNRKMYATQTFT